MDQHKNVNATKVVAAYYWRHVKAYPKIAAGIAFSLPLAILINGYLPPLILANVLNRLSKHQYQDHHIWSSFGPLLLIYFGLILLGVAAWRLTDLFAWRLEAHIEQNIAEEVFSHMINESADFHANNFSGSLVSQTGKLLTGYVRTADTTIFQTYPLIAGIAFTAIILGQRAPLFVALLVTFAIIYIVIAIRISQPVQRESAKFAAAQSRETGYLADAITNVMTIKSFARGNYERQRFHRATLNSQHELYNFARIHRKQMNYLGVSSRTISALSLTMAVIGVMVFQANIATVFLILSYTGSIVDQLFSFSNNALRNYNRSFGDAIEMVDILAQAPAVQDPLHPELPRIHSGEIIFDNVSFTHAGADDSIFENLSLQIVAGEKVGLVGHSGSGKTTFTRLLLRLSDVDGGNILLDGQNITHITQEDLHRNIAYVPQEPMLFHRTIAENVGYGKDNANQQTIEQAAKYSHAAEFIELLPNKYKTLVGERGVKLSGGQRQRIAIARAMIKDAPILVLDEATSALDSESEKLIQDALWKLMEGRTAIVIAHRLSTIQKMDRIIVLSEGKIAEQGNHKELLKHDGIYASLWAHQSGGFLED